MVSTFTPNIQLEEPARGDDVGTWDTPVNANMTLIDKVVGAITTIGLNNSNVVLSAAQFGSKTIIFNSTLTGSVIIFFPSSFTKSYEIQNLCSGTSAFNILLTAPTSQSGQFVSCPPGEIVDVVNDGVNIKFKNLGRVGSYWDYAGSSVPLWVSNCGTNNVGFAPVPYLNCDGSAFSSATYPALTVVLGGTTLPNSLGRFRATLNQGSGNLSSAGGNLDGNTIRATGGAQSITLAASQIPSITAANAAQSITVSAGGHVAFANSNWAGTAFAAGAIVSAFTAGSVGDVTSFTGSNAITVTSNNTGGGASANVPPAYIGGITMIRTG